MYDSISFGCWACSFSTEIKCNVKEGKKQYTKVLQKYVGKGNDEYSIPKFALVDIDRNGIPDLMIQKDGQITGEMLYYTCKKSNKKLVKIKDLVQKIIIRVLADFHGCLPEKVMHFTEESSRIYG